MRVKTESEFWIFFILILIFACAAVVVEHTVLAAVAGSFFASLLIAPFAAAPIAYIVGRKLQQLNALHDEREKLINFDRLTKVLTREGFFSSLNAKPDQHGVTFMIDLDYFKRVNDTYGHFAGDHLLSHVAGIIAENIRPQDIVGRFGGEEFVVFLSGASIDEAQVIGERLRSQVEWSCLTVDDKCLTATISIGAAHMSPRSDFERAMQSADRALYRAKSGGRNRLVFYRPSEAA